MSAASTSPTKKESLSVRTSCVVGQRKRNGLSTTNSLTPAPIALSLVCDERFSYQGSVAKEFCAVILTFYNVPFDYFETFYARTSRLFDIKSLFITGCFSGTSSLSIV